MQADRPCHLLSSNSAIFISTKVDIIDDNFPSRTFVDLLEAMTKDIDSEVMRSSNNCLMAI